MATLETAGLGSQRGRLALVTQWGAAELGSRALGLHFRTSYPQEKAPHLAAAGVQAGLSLHAAVVVARPQTPGHHSLLSTSWAEVGGTGLGSKEPLSLQTGLCLPPGVSLHLGPWAGHCPVN